MTVDFACQANKKASSSYECGSGEDDSDTDSDSTTDCVARQYSVSR